MNQDGDCGIVCGWDIIDVLGGLRTKWSEKMMIKGRKKLQYHPP